MELKDVAEVVQVVGAASANTKLKEGWQLLAITGAGNGSKDGETHLWYVLGKPRAKKEADAITLGAHVTG